MTEIGKLRRKRGHIKSTITSVIKVLDTWQDDPENNELFLLKVVNDSMIKAFENFEDIQDQIEDIDDTEVATRGEIQASYNMTRARVNKILHDAINPNNQQNHPPRNVNSQPHSLPTIPLPTFDGSLENWASFFNIFSSMIDQEDITDVRKLQYLRLAVTGSASGAIESLETNDENYQVALSILKGKYDNTRRASERHWTMLREYPRLTKDTPQAINNLVDTFNQHTRALKSLKAPVDEWDIPLNDLILSKVSNNTAWQWELTIGDEAVPSYKKLLKFLEKRAIRGGKSHTESNYKHNKNQSQAFVTNKPQTNQSKNESIPSTSKTHNKQQETSTVQCPQCNESHKLYSCQNFRNLSVEDRRKLITTASLCFNCFGKGHSATDCKSRYSCHKCRKRHNTLLHFEYPTNTTTQHENLEENENTQI